MVLLLSSLTLKLLKNMVGLKECHFARGGIFL